MFGNTFKILLSADKGCSLSWKIRFCHPVFTSHRLFISNSIIRQSQILLRLIDAPEVADSRVDNASNTFDQLRAIPKFSIHPRVCSGADFLAFLANWHCRTFRRCTLIGRRMLPNTSYLCWRLGSVRFQNAARRLIPWRWISPFSSGG